MQRYFQSEPLDVSDRYRVTRPRTPREAPPTPEQRHVLASWTLPRPEAPTAPAVPAARRLQGWRVP